MTGLWFPGLTRQPPPSYAALPLADLVRMLEEAQVRRIRMDSFLRNRNPATRPQEFARTPRAELAAQRAEVLELLTGLRAEIRRREREGETPNNIAATTDTPPSAPR